jgi:hypothetical protein
MRSMNLLRRIGILLAFAMLSGTVAPAHADDRGASGGKDKKAATSQQKSKPEKNKAGSAASKDTTPAYPNLGAPSGY